MKNLVIFAIAKNIIENRVIRFTYIIYSHYKNGVVKFQIFKLRFLDVFRETGKATPILNLKTYL